MKRDFYIIFVLFVVFIFAVFPACRGQGDKSSSEDIFDDATVEDNNDIDDFWHYGIGDNEEILGEDANQEEAVIETDEIVEESAVEEAETGPQDTAANSGIVPDPEVDPEPDMDPEVTPEPEGSPDHGQVSQAAINIVQALAPFVQNYVINAAISAYTYMLSSTGILETYNKIRIIAAYVGDVQPCVDDELEKIYNSRKKSNIGMCCDETLESSIVECFDSEGGVDESEIDNYDDCNSVEWGDMDFDDYDAFEDYQSTCDNIQDCLDLKNNGQPEDYLEQCTNEYNPVPAVNYARSFFNAKRDSCIEEFNVAIQYEEDVKDLIKFNDPSEE